MTAVELATAYISIVPSFRGIQAQMTDALKTTRPQAAAAGDAAGKEFADSFTAAARGLGDRTATSLRPAAAQAGTAGHAAGGEFTDRFGTATRGIADQTNTPLRSTRAAAGTAGHQAGGEFTDQFGNATRGLGATVSQSIRVARNSAGGEGNAAGDAFSKSFGAAAKGLAAGFGIAALAGLALNAESATANLKAQLHLTTAETEQFGGVARQVFADNFAGDLTTANDAVKSVILNIGGMRTATTETMTSITEQVSAVASVFGVDLVGVTQAVGQMLKTGLAPDAQSALDIIAAGFQVGDDKAGDFLDTINEYATQFRKLGIDGTTATGLLSQGLQGGARDADLVADAFKEFSLRAIDGSTTTAAAYTALGLSATQMTSNIAAGGKTAADGTELVLTKLRAVKDPATQAAIATGLFGSQAEDLGKALYDLDLTTAAAGLGDVAGRAGEVAASGNTAAGGIASFWHSLQNTATTIGNAVLPMLEPLLPLLGWVGAAAGDAAGFFSGLPGPIKFTALALGAVLLLRGPLMGVMTTIDGFGQSLARTFSGGMLSGVKSLGAGLGTALAGAWPFLAIAAVTLALSYLIPKIFQASGAEVGAKNASDNWASAVDDLSQALQDNGGVIDENIRKIALADLHTAKWGKSSTDLTSYADRLGLTYGDLVDGMLGVPGASQKISDAYDSQVTSLEAVIAAGTTYNTDGAEIQTADAANAESKLRYLREQHDAYAKMPGVIADATAEAKKNNDAIKGGSAEAAAVAKGGLAQQQTDYVAWLQQRGRDTAREQNSEQTRYLDSLDLHAAQVVDANKAGAAAAVAATKEQYDQGFVHASEVYDNFQSHIAGLHMTVSADGIKTFQTDSEIAFAKFNTDAQAAATQASLFWFAMEDPTKVTTQQTIYADAAAIRAVGAAYRDAAAATADVTTKQDALTAAKNAPLAEGETEDQRLAKVAAAQRDLDSAKATAAGNDSNIFNAQQTAGSTSAKMITDIVSRTNTHAEAVQKVTAYLTTERKAFIDAQIAAGALPAEAAKAADAIGLIPSHAETIIDADPSQLLKKADEASTAAEKLAKKKVEAQLTANAAAHKKTLDEANARNLANKTATLNGDPLPFNGVVATINGVQIPGKTVNIGGNTTPLEQDIQAAVDRATVAINSWVPPAILEGPVGAGSSVYGASDYNFPAPGKARGGDIVGAGTGTSDSVPIWASTGEFMSTAASTARHHAQLVAWNASPGMTTKMAGGGDIRYRTTTSGPLIGTVIQQPGQSPWQLAADLDRRMAFMGGR